MNRGIVASAAVMYRRSAMGRWAGMAVVAIGALASALLATSLQAGLIGYWKFDGDANDSSGQGNHGSVSGTVSFVQGKFGGANGAASFDNSMSDYVNVPDSASLRAAWPGYVVSLWVHTAQWPSSFMGKWVQAYLSGFVMVTDGQWYQGTGAGPGYAAVGGGVYSGSVWKNLVFRWDGSTLSSYLNGVQQNSTAATAFINNTSRLTFGRDNRDTGFPYDGLMDDAAIFNQSLTVAECKAIHNAGNSALAYSVADMNRLFAIHAAGAGTTNTSDGWTWAYVAGGLPGTAGQPVVSGGYVSIVLADTGSAGVRASPPPSWWTGLIGYWKFDGDPDDSSGQGNHGSVSGTVSFVQGKFGGANGAASFDNSMSDYVNVPDSASLRAAWPGYVVSLWVNTAQWPSSFMGKWVQAYLSGFVMVTDGQWYQGTGADPGYAAVGGGVYSGSVWKNLVFRWDGSTLSSYLNGVQQNSTAATAFINNTSRLTFGRDNRDTGFPYEGLMDDAAIFNQSLTVAECKAIYNVGNSALAYSVADMNKLFAIHAAGAGTATTSDGRVWHYVASGLSGAPGQLVLSGAQYSLVLSDTGSAGVVWQPPTGTAVMIL